MQVAKWFARKAGQENAEATTRLKSETRRLLHLDDEVIVSVNELSCPEFGCPDIETIVAVLIAGERPRVARIGKRVLDVTTADLTAGFITAQSSDSGARHKLVLQPSHRAGGPDRGR